MIKTESPIYSIYGAIPYLPRRLGGILRLFCAHGENDLEKITEIHIRAGGAFSISFRFCEIYLNIHGQTTKYPVICTQEEVDECVERLCDSSYHSHEDEIKNGYISLKNGMRAGVAPTFSSSGEVYSVNSVNIRLPREIHGVSDALYAVTQGASTLIFSPPGVGKTTVLKDMIRNFSNKGVRCAVIDTRGELSNIRYPLADYFLNGDRAHSIECAVRTMCPQSIVCDEIGRGEAQGIIDASNTGVNFTASCHGASVDEIMHRPFIKELCRACVFEYCARLVKNGLGVSFDICKCNI